MRYHGEPLTASLTRSFSLPRGDAEPVLLQLSPLPLGFHQRLRERGLTLPVPPLRIARDAAGKALRDAQGQAVTHPDLQAAEYRQELERYHQRVAVLAVAESLRDDPSVEFETPLPSENGWGDYADRIFGELEQSGFTAGDLILLCREVCRLSNLLDDHLVAAQRNFSSATGSGTS